MHVRRRVTAFTGLIILFIALVSARPAAAVDLKDEVFYHFMPIAWRDSDGDAQRFGDFDGMTASLDYLVELGVTAVWMNPIFPSPAYHGYQHGAADQLNTWFGTEAQWVNFVESAHDRGLKVYVDLVAYGISHNSPWFVSAFGNPSSIYDDWLAFNNASNTDYLGAIYNTWNGASVGFIHWDLRNPSTVSMVTGWAQKWLDPNSDGNFDDGLDGYRLDHVWTFYPNGPDGWGYNLQDFWVPWRLALQSVNPDVKVFAEQADWGTFGQQLLPGMDAAFTKPFEFAARDALRWEWAQPLYDSMQSTVLSLASSPSDRTYMATIGNHDVSRLASDIGDSFEKGRAAAAVLLLQPFAPVIYFGDEIGMRGSKNTSYSGDAADIPMREPFKWNAVAGPPMTNYHVLNGAAFAGQISQDNDGRSVQEQILAPGSQLSAYRELIALRKASVALRHGSYAPVPNGTSDVWSYVREDAAQTVLVAINLSSVTRNFNADLSGFSIPAGQTTPVSLRDGTLQTTLDGANQSAYPISLPAYEWTVLELEIEALPLPPTAADGLDLQGQTLAVQSNPTDSGDNFNEFDQLLLREVDDNLILGVGGNFTSDSQAIVVYVDADPASGQTTLDLGNPGVPPYGQDNMNGTRFDDGFRPETMLYLNQFQGVLYVDQLALSASGGSVKTYRGSAIMGLPTGPLSGGSNPNSMEIAVDNSNGIGVTDNSGSGGEQVFSGIELVLPFADLGIDAQTSSVRISVVLYNGDGTTSNQWLPPIGPNDPAPAIAPDLRLFSGLQFANISLAGGAVDVPVARSHDLRLWPNVPNPFNPSTLLRFEVGGGHVSLEIFDLAGRRVRTLVARRLSAGEHRLVWNGRDDSSRTVATGVYLARLKSAGQTATRRLLLIK